MSKRKGFSLKDNELTKDWNLEDILDVEGEDMETKSFKEKKYPSLTPKCKMLVRIAGVAAAVVITIVGSFAFVKSGAGSVSAMTAQAKEETRVVTNEYLASMNNSENGVLHVDEKKIDDVSKKVSSIITKDMVKGAGSGDSKDMLSKIENDVADILRDDPEFTANLSDDDMNNIINSVSAIVKSELADTVNNDKAAITITASSTKNIDEIQRKVNTSSDELVGLAGRINDTKGEITALSQRVDSFVNNQNNVNQELGNRINEAGSKGRDGADGSNGVNGNASQVKDYTEEIKLLKDRLEQMESDYESLSGDYAKSKQSIAALQIAASGFADTADVVAVADSLTEMNSQMQLQLSEIMSQIGMLEAKNSQVGVETSGVDAGEYDALKSQVGALQKQLQDAADTVGKMMNMPEGSDLSTVLGQYMETVQGTNNSLEKEFSAFKAKVESDERRYDAMYEDYNELLLNYKESTGSILTLSQILATKGDKKDLEALQQYSYQLYKQVISNHNTVMTELYGDGYVQRDPNTAPTPIGYSNVDDGINNGQTGNGDEYTGQDPVSGNTGDGSTGTAPSDGNASGGNATGDRPASSKSIREQLSDLRDDVAEEASEREEQINKEKEERQQDISDVRDEMKAEAEQTAEDIRKIFEQIWGIKPGEERVSELDNSGLLAELDAQINAASERLGQLSQSYASSDGGSGVQTDTNLQMSSGSLAQAVSNVVSAYQTADNAIIDALKQETASRKASDKDIHDQIEALSDIVEENNSISTSDTLAIKKAIAPYVKSSVEHDAIEGDSYIYYDGAGLDGRGFYHVDKAVAADADLEGSVRRTTVADAIKAANKDVGELIKLIQGNEEFAKRYKLK